jgi:hypothetical protein
MKPLYDSGLCLKILIHCISDLRVESNALGTPLLEQLQGAIVLEKLSQIIKKFPTFHGTRRFILVFTNRPYPETLESIQPPHTLRLFRLILVLSSNQPLFLPNGFFSLGVPTKILYADLVST